MNRRILRLVTSLLDWFVPRNCLGCCTEITGTREWCGACRAQLEPNTINHCLELPLLAPWRFAGPLRHAIHRLKYEERSDFAARLAADGFGSRPTELGAHALLVPVPLHPNRLVERGYNQSALLARAMARNWGVAVKFNLLRRCSHTSPQVGQSREQRMLNVQGAFSAQNRAPKRSGTSPLVWLVDDVVTTGATARSCRAALEDQGLKLGGTIALAHACTKDVPDAPIDA